MDSSDREVTQRTRPTGLWQASLRWLKAHTFAPSWLPGRWAHPAVGYLAAVVVQIIVITGLVANTVNLSGFRRLLLCRKKRDNQLDKLLKALSWLEGFWWRQMTLLGFLLIVDAASTSRRLTRKRRGGKTFWAIVRGTPLVEGRTGLRLHDLCEGDHLDIRWNIPSVQLKRSGSIPASQAASSMSTRTA